MYYGEIKNCDIANGEGVRVTLFVSGCTNRCKGCFQPQTWDFSYGQPFTAETEERLLSLLSPSYINGLTVLGGEPFEPENQRALVPFLRRVRQTYPGKTIWCFSGFTYEELTADGAHPRCGVTDEICILTATSGDTGSAALSGFADVPGTRIVVFYPEGGVSPAQERQMTTREGGKGGWG